jgi:hypothetical protein
MTGYKAAHHAILAFLVLGVFTSESRAVLLAEVGINIPPTFDPVPPATDSVLYRFGMLSLTPFPVGGEWAPQVIAADVGKTFEAPPEIVSSFVQPLTRPGADVSISVHRSSFGRTLDQLQAGAWPECCDIVTFRKFAPDITKVPVNRLTMTINSFHFQRAGDTASIGGSHLIRIYGVPEPATLVLFCTCALLAPRPRKRKVVRYSSTPLT